MASKIIVDGKEISQQEYEKLKENKNVKLKLVLNESNSTTSVYKILKKFNS